MKWKQSDAQGRQGVAITDVIISGLGHICRPQESNDRGIDAHIELVQQDNLEATGEIVALQVKGGPSYLEEVTATGFVHRGSLDHLDYWLNHCLPVFLVLVDTAKRKAYWQEVSEKTVERLPKGWKVEVPFTNELETNFIIAARHRAGLEPASANYTRLKLDDISHGMTKRYRAPVLVTHPVTRLRLEAVVRRATSDIRNETFHRTEPLSERFRAKDADVVCLFVAGDPVDAANANWLCRSAWVNPLLAPDARPHPIGGVDLGDGLEVVWNTDYTDMGRFLKTLETDKQTFLGQVRHLVGETERLVTQTFGSGDKCIVDEATTRSNVDAMRLLFLKSSDIGLAPYECRDVEERFDDVMALADNAFMHADPARRQDRSDAARDFLLETTLRDCRKNLERLRYEIEKVT